MALCVRLPQSIYFCAYGIMAGFAAVWYKSCIGKGDYGKPYCLFIKSGRNNPRACLEERAAEGNCLRRISEGEKQNNRRSSV